jgi:hypothetical protein
MFISFAIFRVSCSDVPVYLCDKRRKKGALCALRTEGDALTTDGSDRYFIVL